MRGGAVKRFLPWFFPVLVAIIALSFWPRLDLNEEVSDLLPDGPGRGELVLLKESGMLDRLLVTVGSENASSLAAGIDLCGRVLEKSGMFRQVFFRVDNRVATRMPQAVAINLPWLMNRDDYRRLDALMSPERLDKQMGRLFLFLNSPRGFGAGDIVAADPLGLTAGILSRTTGLAGSLRFSITDGHIVSLDRTHGLVIAESRTSLTDSAQAAGIAKILAGLKARLKNIGATIKITGPLPHTLANRATIRRDLVLLLPLASLVLILFLTAAFRSPAGIALFLIPALAAPPAVVLAAGVYGRLSSIALGFGIVLLGIGVDFAVHLYFARKSGQSISELALPLSAAAATTIGCFVILLFSRIPVHRQMGALAIAGLSYALVLAVFLVPTLLPRGRRWPDNNLSPPVRKRGRAGSCFVLAVWVVFVVAAILAWPGLRFAGDMRQMDASGPEVAAAENSFARIWGSKGNEEVIIGANGVDLSAALDANDRVAAALAGETGRVRSLAPILPGPACRRERIARWRDFWSGPGRGFGEKLQRAGMANGFSARAFAPFLARTREPGQFSPAALLDALPPAMRDFFIRKDAAGRPMLLTTFIARDRGDIPARLALLGAGVRMFYPAKWRRGMAVEFRKETATLAARALILVALVALVFLRRPRQAFAAMAPVLAALAAMVLFVRLGSTAMNLMHILMGIMVCGLSIDYGIFAVAGDRESSSRAVSVCAVSTLVGFGVFAFAAHPALRSLGLTTLVGIAAAWPTALLVTPLLGGRC